jgi:hypothetical protein
MEVPCSKIGESTSCTDWDFSSFAYSVLENHGTLLSNMAELLLSNPCHFPNNVIFTPLDVMQNLQLGKSIHMNEDYVNL